MPDERIGIVVKNSKQTNMLISLLLVMSGVQTNMKRTGMNNDRENILVIPKLKDATLHWKTV